MSFFQYNDSIGKSVIAQTLSSIGIATVSQTISPGTFSGTYGLGVSASATGVQYIAFSYGPKAGEHVGEKAPGWNICISDLDGKWVQITTDGHHDKEPDWVPLP